MYRFRDRASYKVWQLSPERAAWFVKAAGHHDETARRELTGLEGWFSIFPVPPPRWKMAISSGMGIFPIALLANIALAPFLVNLPVVVRTVIIAALFSTPMTYLIMPIVTKALRRWLSD